MDAIRSQFATTTALRSPGASTAPAVDCGSGADPLLGDLQHLLRDVSHLEGDLHGGGGSIPHETTFGGAGGGIPHETMFGGNHGVPGETLFGGNHGIPGETTFGGAGGGIPRETMFGGNHGVPGETLFGGNHGIPSESLFGGAGGVGGTHLGGFGGGAFGHELRALERDIHNLQRDMRAHSMERGMNTGSACAELANFMQKNGVGAINTGDLQQLAAGHGAASDNPKLQAAAMFMMKHPQQWEKVETDDVATPDGISGLGNLLKFAEQGGQGQQAGGLGQGGGLGGRLGGDLGELMKDLRGLEHDMRAQSLEKSLGTGSACQVLANYMQNNGMSTIDTDQLSKLAEGGGEASRKPLLQAAAMFMMQHPQQWQKVETADVAQPDGLSGIGNLQQFAAMGDDADADSDSDSDSDQ